VLEGCSAAVGRFGIGLDWMDWLVFPSRRLPSTGPDAHPDRESLAVDLRPGPARPDARGRTVALLV